MVENYYSFGYVLVVNDTTQAITKSTRSSIYIKMVARIWDLVRVPYINTLSNPSFTQIICIIVVLKVLKVGKLFTNFIEIVFSHEQRHLLL